MTAATMPPPPQTPRPVTPAVRHRSLIEPRVRAWWVAGLVLLAISAFFAVDRSLQWNRIRWLVHHGVSVTATVYQIGDYESGLRANASPDNVVYMYYYTDDPAQTRKTPALRGHFDRIHIAIAVKPMGKMGKGKRENKT